MNKGHSPETLTRDDALAIHGGQPARDEAIFTGVWPSEEARKNINDMMESGLLSSYYSGPWCRRFEEEFADFIGPDQRAISVNSGTSALHLALEAAGVQRGDEVIVPALCFVAAVTAVVQIGALPIICDAEPQSLTMDPEVIRELITPRTKAVIVVHFWGHPADMETIAGLCAANGLTLIEDCAQAFGACVGRRMVGTFGEYATYAFSVRKHISCGEGGMVVCRGEARHARLRVLSNYGKGPAWDDYESVGFNYRMPEFSAIVGLDGLARVDEEIAARRFAGQHYAELFASQAPEVVPEPHWGRSAYFKCPVLLPDGAQEIRNAVVDAISAENISCRIPHRPLFRIDWLQEYLRTANALRVADDCPVARDAHARLIELETGPFLPEPEARRSGAGVMKVWRHFAGTA